MADKREQGPGGRGSPREKSPAEPIANEVIRLCAERLGVPLCDVQAFVAELGEGEDDAIEALCGEPQPLVAPDRLCENDPCRIYDYQDVDLGAMLARRFTRKVDARLLRDLTALLVACSLVPLRLTDCLDIVLDATICDEDLAREVHQVSVATRLIGMGYPEPNIIGADVQKAIADGASSLVDACIANDASSAMAALVESFRGLWSASLAVRLGQANQTHAMILGLFDNDSLARELEPGCSPDGVSTVLDWCYRQLRLPLDASLALYGNAALAQLIRPASTYLWILCPSTARQRAHRFATIARDAPMVHRTVTPVPRAPESQPVLTMVTRQVS